VAFPVEAPDLQSRVADELKLYLADDTQAWVLNPTGHYERAESTDHVCAQTRLLSLYDERVALTDA
jgi:polyphosphate kinase